MTHRFRHLFLITSLLVLTLLTGSFQALAQSGATVKGRIVDKAGEAIMGARIHETGTSNGAVSNLDGEFSLKLQSSPAKLEISSIGFDPQTIEVKGGEDLRITLTDDIQQLNELVVVGYQTLRKTDVVGAVSSIKADELNVAAPTVGQSLVGKVSGVQIAQVSGAPYNSTKIRVRGVASINASSDPLYVIDGYPSNSDLMLNPEDIASIEILKDAASAAIYGSRAAGGVVLITTKRGREGKPRVNYTFQYSFSELAKKVNLLNARQFTDLHVEGHNNAYKNMLISAGKQWDDSYFRDTNEKRAERQGSRNNAAMIPEFMYDFDKGQIIEPKYDTDWQDELYRLAPGQRHNISVNGGSDRVRYDVSLGYQDNAGLIHTTGQKRLNLRSNVDIEVNDKVRIGANYANTTYWNSEIQEGRFNQGPVLGALIYAPIFRCYDENGNILKGEMTSYSSGYAFQQIENPVALATETKISRIGTRDTYNMTATYEPVKDLFLKANLGMFSYNVKYEFYRPTSLSSGTYQPESPQAQAAANAIARTMLQKNYLGEFTANYSKTFGDVHNFSGVAGYSMQRDTWDQLGVRATGFEDNHIPEVTGHGADPSNIALNGTNKSNWSMISYFTRLNYNYDNRYYLTGSFRGDASSYFGPANRWAYFPSISGAWTLSNEDFYKESLGTTSTLKLRASWGMSGNNNIGNYQYITEMRSPGGVVFGNGSISTSMAPGGIKDNTISWETTSQYNIGADLSLWSNRLSLSANYYRSFTQDLLFSQPISAISGATSMMTNLPNSRILNTGCDFQADARLVSSQDFNLNMSGNIFFNRNKVLELDGGNTIITNGAERSYKTHITMEGEPIGMFYGFKVLGMVTEADLPGLAKDHAVYKANGNSFPEGYKLQGPARSLSQSMPLRAGDLYFEDTNGDGVVDDKDKEVIGSPHPLFTYGLNLSGNYKALDFSASFNGSQGNQVLDGQDYYLFNMEGSGNQYVEADQRYRSPQNPGNGWVYKASRGGTQSNSTRLSTFYLQDGSFFRCTNLNIGYTFKGLQDYTRGTISGLRIYASGDNLFTLTKYKGYNPEVDYNNGANLTPGVDYGKYPLARTYTMGLQLTF